MSHTALVHPLRVSDEPKTCARPQDTRVRRDATTLGWYLAAAAVYVVLGVVLPELLLSWIVGVAYLLAAVWVVPALVRRLR
jgi:hypothetical protein